MTALVVIPTGCRLAHPTDRAGSTVLQWEKMTQDDPTNQRFWGLPQRVLPSSRSATSSDSGIERTQFEQTAAGGQKRAAGRSCPGVTPRRQAGRQTGGHATRKAYADRRSGEQCRLGQTGTSMYEGSLPSLFSSLRLSHAFSLSLSPLLLNYCASCGPMVDRRGRALPGRSDLLRNTANSDNTYCSTSLAARPATGPSEGAASGAGGGRLAGRWWPERPMGLGWWLSGSAVPSPRRALGGDAADARRKSAFFRVTARQGGQTALVGEKQARKRHPVTYAEQMHEQGWLRGKERTAKHNSPA